MANQQAQKNVFNDGVVSDLDKYSIKNSMLVHGRNLSFVTGENNNFIMTNIKGNEKLVDVYLTDGFLPIGVVEYLGIAYIASYNPDTGEGEFGSFPAPNYIDGNIIFKH